MRHIFILNPKAGHENRVTAIKEQISAAAARCAITPEYIVTEYKGHATKQVDRIASESEEMCRFYACGGDGTLNEVCSGAAGHTNAQVACYPCGTGNDFIKIFDNRDAFGSFDNLINGTTEPIDVMEAAGHRSVNILSAGLDARVAEWVCRNKRKVPLGGKVPYDAALLVTFFRKLGRYYEVEIDGKKYDGDYYIIVAASGRYYGGGYYVMPQAEPGDGLLDFLLIKNVGRLKMLKLIGPFQHGQQEKLGDAAIYVRGRSMKLRSRDAEPLNTDGEIYPERECEIKIMPEQLDIVVPVGAHIIHNANASNTARI